MRRRSVGALVLGLLALAPVSPSSAAVPTASAPAGGPGAAVETIGAVASEAAPFQMIGASWVGPSAIDIEVRVRSEGVWHEWQPLHADGGTGSDEGATERVVTEPLWVSSADAYELQLPPEAVDVQAHLVRTDAAPGPGAEPGAFTAQATVPGAPAMFPRSAWGARAPKDVIYTTTKMAFVHHTAGTNDYAASEVPAILRGIQAYHMDANGWDDIAYNFLVDRFGRIWEGRGGVDRTVRGGHTGGFNTGSVGVAALGDFTTVTPSPAIIGATADIVGWVLGRAGVDPASTVTMTAGGHANSRYPAGEVVSLPAVSGHRDVSYTSCPGALQDALGAIRQRAALRAAQANSPFGSVDAARAAPGGLAVSGWAIDPNTDRPIDVHVYVGAAGHALKASRSRPDVGAAFGFGADHGFSAVLPAPVGRSTVCIYGINTGVGGNSLLGCRNVTVTDDPVGSVDRVERGPGGVDISGWAIDPNIASAIDVHAYVGGVGVAVTANRSRPDLLAWYPDYGSNHGFSATVPAVAGRQRTCTYAINRSRGANTVLDCREITVEVSPMGSLDSVRRTASGMSVGGWAIDPDVATPISVHVYSNGVFVGAMTASANRPDVAAVYRPYGASHGFRGVVTARPGRQTVCAYGINTKAGGNALLGCSVVG